jgi:hypothetical protein
MCDPSSTTGILFLKNTMLDKTRTFEETENRTITLMMMMMMMMIVQISSCRNHKIFPLVHKLKTTDT